MVNIMSEWFVEAANHTCGNFDRGVNEMELAGLTSMPSVMVRSLPLQHIVPCTNNLPTFC